jgi:hypothetical protein
MDTVMKIGNMALNAQQAYKVIHSVGWDAANAHAAKNGRTVWTDEDYNEACRVSNDLMVKFGLVPAPKAKKIRASKVRN